MTNPADEHGFQTCVIDVAHLAGWRVAHFRAGRTADGWRTPVTADGAGWPDLVCVRGDRIIFAELKSDTGKLSARQRQWLDVLQLIPGCEVYVWRPGDWAELVQVLTGRPPRGVAA